MKNVRKLKWFVMNAIFLWLMYLSFVKEIDGAYNLLMVFAWVVIVLSFFLVSDDVIEKFAEQGLNRSVPRYIDITLDMFIVCVFAWFGNIFTAIFWIVHFLIVDEFYRKVDEKMEAIDEAK